MIIPSVGFDLWPMYSLIGLLILASFSNWVWRIIIAKYPLENWWCGDQTDSRWAQHPPASAVVVPEELFYGNNEELINLMVIPGRDICPRIIQELVSKFHTRWRTTGFMRQVLEDLKQSPAPLPEFLLESSGKKNGKATAQALQELYGDNT